MAYSRCVSVHCRYYNRAAGIADPSTDPHAAKRALIARIGEPCDSCKTLVSAVACAVCKAIMCAVCSDDIHDEDGPLGGHKVLHSEVRRCVGAGGRLAPLHVKRGAR